MQIRKKPLESVASPSGKRLSGIRSLFSVSVPPTDDAGVSACEFCIGLSCVPLNTLALSPERDTGVGIASPAWSASDDNCSWLILISSAVAEQDFNLGRARRRHPFDVDQQLFIGRPLGRHLLGLPYTLPSRVLPERQSRLRFVMGRSDIRLCRSRRCESPQSQPRTPRTQSPS